MFEVRRLLPAVGFSDETGFHSDLTDIFDSEIIVKADFVHASSLVPAYPQNPDFSTMEKSFDNIESNFHCNFCTVI
ncbi:unnamed protein product [Acanthoscelides obtectus]|uniref:Uncharacterized protein n=1 Tax=Acanthoscelides obtectus TaxID=200917 RepID=A0A9P0JPX6_ACAOB|nr:unnamed protein product [Acanthoscelides obtectus]CAK1667052.1 hypothetical protein AOBTE_LOCUS25645 [Acanthoscelides obtectus]